MEWILKHKLLSLIFAFMIAFTAWYFLSGSSSAPVVTAEAPDATPSSASELVQSLITLRAVTLDGSIFSNPAFSILKDFSVQITLEPVGRNNPFAPLPGGGASAAQQGNPQLFAPSK